MLTESLVLGGDLGGTSTRILVARTDGGACGRGTAGAGNPISHPAGAEKALGDALRAALSGVDPGRVRASVIGVAGGSALRTPMELYQTAKRSWPSGFVLGLMTTTTSRSACTVAGSSLAASW